MARKPIRRTPVARAPKAPNTVNPPVAESAASHVADTFYSPNGGGAAESPLADVRVPGEIHVGDRVAKSALPPRHPTERFDQDEDLSGDQDVVASAEIDGEDIEESLDEAIARIAKIRKPLGTFSQKLAIPKRAGYHTHWFNDEGNRIAEALDNGWAFRKKDGKPIKRAVGTGRDKGVLWACAMDLPEVFWLADMQTRHDIAQGKMDALKANPVVAPAGTAQKSDAGKFYSPSEMLTVEKSNAPTPVRG